MKMSMTQKILANHTGSDSVQPGQLVKARLDLVMGNDATFPISLREFKKAGFDTVFDPNRIVLVMDHFTPNKDIKAAENCRLCREFAFEQGIENFYDVGRMGVEHALLPEKGFVAPGEVIIGGDSHTCTYGALGAFSTGVGSTDICVGAFTGEAWFKVPSAIRINLVGALEEWVSGKDVMLEILSRIGVSGAAYKSMEFGGSGLATLSIDDRFTIANMAIECGAKNGVFEVDEKTLAYLEGRVTREFTVYTSDGDEAYESVTTINLSKVKPMVALPPLPANGIPADEVPEVRVDQVFIGSCTNGRISDIEIAAKILKGKKVAKGVRVLIIPATQDVYLQALKAGYLETFIEAGCAVSTPTCGACGGGHMGLLGKDEVVLSTSNRNFVGRMGHIDSKIYLCSPATAAASALTGVITGPARVNREVNK